VLQRDDAPAVVDLLRQVISQPMEDIRQVLLLQDASSTALPVSGPSPSSSSSSSSSVASASIKKTEEMVVSKLWMIEKAIRGAAEILGDVLPLVEEGSSSSSPPPPWLSTGRDEILADLGRPEDRQYLASIRLQVAQFLQFFQEEIQQQQLSGQQQHQQLSGQQQQAPMSSLPSTEHHPCLASSLRNNLSIQKLWTQLLNLLLTRRMSCLKDVDSMRQVRMMVHQIEDSG
jgi:hypothetical protein